MGLSATGTTLNALQFESGMGRNGLYWLDSSQDSLTATGSNQAGALQLTCQNNRLTMVSAGSGVILPPALPGIDMIIANHGANNVQVYGNGSDTLDDVAGATGISQMTMSTVLYMCMTKGAWYTEGLAGYVSGVSTAGSGAYATQSFQGPITATASGSQSASILVNAMMCLIGTPDSGVWWIH